MGVRIANPASVQGRGKEESVTKRTYCTNWCAWTARQLKQLIDQRVVDFVDENGTSFSSHDYGQESTMQCSQQSQGTKH